MRKLFTTFTLLTLLSTTTFSAEFYRNSEAATRVRGAQELWYKSNSTTPSYIALRKDFVLAEEDVLDWLRGEFKLQADLDFVELKAFSTNDGAKHVVYGMLLKGITLEFIRLTIHSKDGKVVAFSGTIPSLINVNGQPGIDAQEAINIAISAVGASKYKWEIPAEEAWLKSSTGNPGASFYPGANLVIVANKADYLTNDFRLAYRINIYAHLPSTSEDVYVDAHNGEILFRHNMINESDSTGIAHTALSGLRQIKTDLWGQNFRLREFERGKGINTWDIENNTEISMATDFYDSDNTWLYAPGDNDVYATDVHWGTELTYDYLSAMFNRNSIDDQGFQLNSYVHYGESYSNARWDKVLKVMMYGDGPGNQIPYSSLDIVAHEIGHGLTQFTADLIYQGESGALNESFSDILGNCAERLGKPGSASWQIGEDLGAFLRDMSYPNTKEQPDTYKGDYWYSGSADNGGVHTNSGVQNYWFFLLSDGGNGINDFGKSYNMDGIGIVNASLIAFHTLSVYLNQISDYEDAAFYSTRSAIDIFGNCSPQHEATVKAWNAVGLANDYIGHAEAAFSTENVTYCQLPVTIDFRNESSNGELFEWEFGDGNSSADVNPSHIYSTYGQFTVKLKADGKGCGTDQIIKENLVTITAAEAPLATSATIYMGDSILLSASSLNGEIYWYADAGRTNLLGKGNSYQTPVLTANTTYYIQTITKGQIKILGERMEDVSGNGQYSNLNLALLFDTYRPVILHSFSVMTKEEGTRTFTIEDANGKIIFSKNVNLTAGLSEVVLDARIPAGLDYQLNYQGTVKNLWFANTAEFPYEHPGLISIKGNSMKMENVYSYFFNIDVRDEDCESEMKEVSVVVEDITTVRRVPYKFYVNNPVEFKYFVDFFFRENTKVKFTLYGINGQLVHEQTKDFLKGNSTENVNTLLNLRSYPSGVYFLTINGGGLEKTEKIINKGGSD